MSQEVEFRLVQKGRKRGNNRFLPTILASSDPEDVRKWHVEHLKRMEDVGNVKRNVYNDKSSLRTNESDFPGTIRYIAKKGKRKSRRNKMDDLLVQDIDSRQLIANRVDTAVDHVRNTLLVTDIVRRLCKSSPDIVCYGLGNFSISPVSLYQLALLILLQQALNSKSVLLFDPLFLKDEIDYLQSYCEFGILPHNEECFRKVEHPTIFFLPHCEYGMSWNIIAANSDSKDNLGRLSILGNSLEGFGPFDANVALHKLLSVSEFPIVEAKNSTIPVGSFNDLVVYTFREGESRNIGDNDDYDEIGNLEKVDLQFSCSTKT